MGVVVYFAGLRSVLEGFAILPFLYTSVEKIKKKALQEGGFLYIINLDVPFWYTIFIKKGTLMVHEKNNTHLKRTQNVKKDRNPILWGTF
ncbi:hypothetical protein [Coprococcus comes]|uniref:Uncharacterized protein n=1 Tax=Coprococcus comes TaxID=410072 RepID=A0A3R6D3P0_9FIRM|nr:hypothetical protein [Coprococcus comes]RHF81520.1 hypothetical protein DW656_13435 [Coprococcus comes]